MSQFTLLASTKKGSKPDFHGAAGGDQARELYDDFFAKVQELYVPERVKNGVFQALMEVGLVNDGPVGVDYRSEDGAVNHDYLSCRCICSAATDSCLITGYFGDPDESAERSREKQRLYQGGCQTGVGGITSFFVRIATYSACIQRREVTFNA